MNHSPRMSIIIPVLNEADIINPLLNHLFRLKEIENCEIIVSDGDPEKRTINSIKPEFSARIRSIQAPLGRAMQMNAGGEIAKGEILLFLHADNQLPNQAIPLVIDKMTNKKLSGGAFSLKIDSSSKVLRWVSLMTTLRSKLTHIPYGDQAIFIKKKVFKHLVGFADLPVLEDVDLMRRMKKAGGKIAILKEKTLTSDRRYQSEGLWKTILRNRIAVTMLWLGFPEASILKASGRIKKSQMKKNTGWQPR